MDIIFKTNKLEKIFNSEKNLKREFGVENCERIKKRMAVLHAAPTLVDVPTEKPVRCHQLKANRKGEFAVDLLHPFRLVFCPEHDPLPLDENGGLDLKQVTCIKILNVEDYH